MSVNDQIMLATGGPTINEGLSTWYSRTASETLDDAERRWLLTQVGAVGRSTGDLWYTVLRAAGHTGSLNDMKLAYWTTEGTVNPFIDFLIAENGDNLTDDPGNLLIV
jgi:hypothetical protein